MAARVDGDIVAVAPLPLIRAVGILSRHKKPLFLKSYVASREAAHQLAMYTAMDGVDALHKDLSIEACGGVARSPFTGLLQLVDDEKTFGWVTGTGIKIFLVTHDRRLHERSVTTLLEALHVAFADAVCGPFTDVDDPSEALGAAFAAKVDAVTAAAADSLPAV